MASESSSDFSKLAESNEQFTKTFYEIVRTKPGNLFFSPISIEAVLALAYAGAKGSTANQIQTAAHLPESIQEAAQSFGNVVSEFEKSNSVTLKFANGLYTDKAFTVNTDYLNLVQKDFRAELGQVNFSKSVEATNEINEWVADKTNQKIPKLFEQGVLDSATKLVLLNAIYFKGNWAKKFPVQNTEKGLFHLNEKETTNVDYMSVKSNFRLVYDETMDADIVELPYEGETVTMLIFVPRKIEGLAQIENKLKDVNIRTLETGRKREVIVKMPKFKLEQTLDLKESLQKMGITDLFSEQKADLRGISSTPLVASEAIQKAFIEVNEEGSEAAAATGMIMAVMSMPLKPLTVIMDKPFIFYLKHNPSAMTLFMGRFASPTQE